MWENPHHPVVIIAHEKVDIKGLLTHLNLKRDDDVLEFNKFKLKEAGISDDEISLLDEDSKNPSLINIFAILIFQ